MMNLRWSGATGQYVDVYRNNGLVGPLVNDGRHDDVLNTSGGTFVYKLCLRGSKTNCSNTPTVIF